MTTFDLAGNPLVHTQAGRPRRRGEFTLGLSLLLLCPVVLLLGWAFFLPIVRLLLTSFTQPAPGFGNYARVLTDPLYLRVFARTAWIGLGCVLLSLCLGYPVAMLMARGGWILARVAAICVLLPLWTSVLVRSYAWIVLLERNGIINQSLQLAGLTSRPLRLLYNDGAVFLAMTHVLLPFMILPIANALKNMPADLQRAATNLGAGPVRVFLSVTFPLSLPGVFAGCLIVFVTSLGFYVTPALLGGPQTLMIATLIGQQALDTLDWPFAGALSTVLLVLSLGITASFKRLLRLDRVTAHD